MTTASASWRDRIATHPAADQFEIMPADELDALGVDIREHGLQQPVVLWTPERYPCQDPKELYLLDGRNRLDAIERAYADDADSLQEAIESALYIGTGGARLLHGDDDPWDFVISANAHRRHLKPGQKRELIEKLLKAKPERSDRSIGKLAQVDHKTVAGVRSEVERRGEIPHVLTRTDTAGRQQTAHRPPPAAVVYRSSLPPPPSKEEQIRRLREQQAQRSVGSPVAAPADDVMAAFDRLNRHLDERREELLHVPLDQLARAVLRVMELLRISIELLEEEADRQ